MWLATLPTDHAGRNTARQALYLKWRPQTFEGVIGQHITRTPRNAPVKSVSVTYLFSGPRGTGKTNRAPLAKASTAAIPILTTGPATCHFCQSVNEGRFMDLIEIDAASHGRR